MLSPTPRLSNPEYHDFLDVFSKADSDVLLPHRPYDHKIPLMEGKIRLWGLL